MTNGSYFRWLAGQRVLEEVWAGSWDGQAHRRPLPPLPDMIDDEGGPRDEKIIHLVKAPADGLCVDGMMGYTPAGLIDHLSREGKAF